MSIKGFSVGGNVERYDYNSLDNLPSEITIDPALSGSSTNPVQNKVVTGAINATTDSVNALSGEVSDLKSALTDITGNSVIPVTATGKYIATNGASADINSPVNDNSYRYFIADASEGDKFTINAVGGSTPRAWAFIKSDGTILSKSLSSATCVNLVLTAPPLSSKLIINSKTTGKSYYGQLLTLANVGLFGADCSVTFTAETSTREIDNLLARRTLAVGRYILRWKQSADVQKHSINSRLGALYKNANGQSTLYYDKFHTPWKKGVYYWVIDITSEEEYRFYMWGSDLSANCTISEFNLYDVTTVIGMMYLAQYEDSISHKNERFYPSMFKNVGFIGDSWTAGSLYNSSNVNIGTFNDYSYASQMARLMGSTPTLYAKGGLSSRGWIDDADGLPKLLADDAQDMYWINLGINDAGEIGNTPGETGIGQPSDYDQGISGSFCYYMGQVIESIQTHAKIVLCDILQLSANQILVSNAIPLIATYYNLPYVRMYDDDFYRSEANHSLLRGSHPTVLVHSGMARANLRLLSKCIDENTAYFNGFAPES